MIRWQTWVGVALGLVVGFTVLHFGGRGDKPAPGGPILSECDGHLRELVIHYEPSAKEITATVYRDFLGALEADVTVHVVCSNRAAFEDLGATIGPVRCQLRPVVVNHALTTWSRDRWVALAPAVPGGPTTLWSPRGEAAEEVWPARAGDERIGLDLAAALAPAVRARRSDLYFDGGDILADRECAFIVPRVLPRNLQHTVQNRNELLKLLAAELKRRIILLEEAPDHHAGMFMMSAGRRTMLVGDPSLARKFASMEDGMVGPAGSKGPAAAGGNADGAVAPGFTNLPGGPDFTPETQHRFDAVAAQCEAAGYQVVRLPVVPARDGRTYLTYVNALMDLQGRRKLVYLPWYRGAEPLNAAGRAVWERLGFEVRPVDCTRAYRHFGSLHCLVNVLRRSEP